MTGGTFLATALLLLGGCGPNGPATYPVTGTVSYQGKPVPLGTVLFVAKDGPPSQPAPIGSEGTYRLEAVAGKHAVQVIAVPPRPGRPDPNVDGGIDYTGAPQVQSLIPTKYNRYHTSGIEVVVEPKTQNTIDIVLR